MSDLLREFLLEADELIESLFVDIEQLGVRYNEGRARRELIGRIFRHVHTIKGTASAAELDATSQIAHELETLLDAARMGRIGVDAELIALLSDTTAAIAQSLQSASRGEPTVASPTLLERLRRNTLTVDGTVSRREEVAGSVFDNLPPDIAKTLSSYEQQRLNEAAREGTGLYLVAVDFELDTFDDGFRRLSAILGENGELISTLPGLESSSPDKINFRILHATIDSYSELVSRLGEFESISTTPLTTPAAEPQLDLSSEASGNEEVESVAIPQSISTLTSVVRVELSDLDDMIRSAHELLTDTLSALEIPQRLDLSGRERTELEIRASRIRRRFVELEERLIGLRMVPIGQILTRAARAGSMAARTLSKSVDIETSGEDVRIDKSVADSISDSMLHVLRNAISHGIESVEERCAIGKPAQGKVLVEAFADGSRVRIRISDDGRGIDPEVVTRAAIERGLIKDGGGLSRQQSLRLIFRPGFSTASAVSSVSGRGVGLDVVERAVEQVGGELRVSSEIGAGTTFELMLPTTLALMPSLVVNSAGYKYAIDASHISEACYIQPSEIEHAEGRAHIIWRGARIPMVSIRRLLAQPEAKVDGQKRLPMVVSHFVGQEIAGLGLSQGEGTLMGGVGVLVDGWEGYSEVLVRSLGRHASRWRGISGAAELPDGSIALVLDLPRLLEMHT
jgi:two-component system chemotaxis sensor kinase CheA